MKLYAYNKPVGEELANKELDGVKLYPISRLDKEDRGLVVYTDDAAQCEALNAKTAAAEMEFHVDTDRKLNYQIIQSIRAGLDINKGKFVTPACTISWTESNAFVISMKPCSKTIIDGICAAFDCKLALLKQYRIENLKIKKVALGAFEEYSEEEVNAFLAK